MLALSPGAFEGLGSCTRLRHTVRLVAGGLEHASLAAVSRFFFAGIKSLLAQESPVCPLSKIGHACSDARSNAVEKNARRISDSPLLRHSHLGAALQALLASSVLPMPRRLQEKSSKKLTAVWQRSRCYPLTSCRSAARARACPAACHPGMHSTAPACDVEINQS